MNSINLFHATDHFPYLLKTSEKQRLSDVFRGYRKTPVARNGLILCYIFGNIDLQLIKESSKLNQHKINLFILINPLSANPTKWSNTLKQFVGNSEIKRDYFKILIKYSDIRIVLFLKILIMQFSFYIRGLFNCLWFYEMEQKSKVEFVISIPLTLLNLFV